MCKVVSDIMGVGKSCTLIKIPSKRMGTLLENWVNREFVIEGAGIDE